MKSAKRLTESTQELTYVLTDFSPSMDSTDYDPSRKAGAILAIKEFIEIKSRFYPQDIVGLIGFDNNAHVLHSQIPIKLGMPSLMQALKIPIETRSGTNFTAALTLAERCLTGHEEYSVSHVIRGYLKSLLFEPEPNRTGSAPINNRITKRIILLTDGEHNGGGSPLSVATRLKQAGVVIECIGIAGRPENVDEKRLRAIASKDDQGKPRYCFIGDTRQLIKKYESMAHHIRAI